LISSSVDAELGLATALSLAGVLALAGILTFDVTAALTLARVLTLALVACGVGALFTLFSGGVGFFPFGFFPFGDFAFSGFAFSGFAFSGFAFSGFAFSGFAFSDLGFGSGIFDFCRGLVVSLVLMRLCCGLRSGRVVGWSIAATSGERTGHETGQRMGNEL
jgi:hypothetical protein